MPKVTPSPPARRPRSAATTAISHSVASISSSGCARAKRASSASSSRTGRLDARAPTPHAPHMNANPAYQIAVWLVPLVIAIVFHEVAHGLVARRLGDPTAERAGRLTFNPLKHIDPFGTVILPLLLALSHAPVFGWAKPVPVAYR